MDKKVLFMRHSKTDCHDQKRVIGTTDIGLNEEGISMVKAKLDELSQYGIESIITSNLKRAYETGEIISEALKIPICVNNGIYERRQGILEGMEFEKVIREHGKVTSLTKIDGREQLKEFMKRITVAIDDICETEDSKVILIIAHSNVLKTFLQINGIRVENWQLCDVKETIYHGNGKWELVD